LESLGELLESNRGGVRAISDEITTEAVEQLAQQRGLHFFRVNCRDVTDKSALLRTLAQTFSFPGYFGGNWDALEECLTDLEWLSGKGYVILLENTARLVQRSPEELQIAMSIFEDSAQVWADRETPFWVLVRGGAGSGRFSTVDAP
jgi:hypothetical protein